MFGKVKLVLIFIFSFLYLTPFFFYKHYKKKIPKISVFIPVYNNEKYIKRSIESVQNQTLRDIEIIVVNDCSNDSSLQILNDYANNDKRIIIVNNDKNRGLLYSRAMGILNSSGEYLMNLDSDDEIMGYDTLEYLYNHTLKNNVDIITFNIFDKKENTSIKCNNINKIIKQPILFKSLFFGNNLNQDYLLWNKLIKKEIFQKAYNAFKKEIYNGKWNYFEDDIWSILVNKFAESKLCLNRLVYIYNYNNNSLMNKRFDAMEFHNILYRHEMYKKIFVRKEDEPYLIAEYFFLFNRLKWELKYLLLLNDNNIKEHIKNIFQYFLDKYNCTVPQRKEINDFLKIITVFSF